MDRLWWACFIAALAIAAGLFAILWLTVVYAGHKDPYDRALYEHWIDADSDCQDTRAEVLTRDALNVVPGCVVMVGTWVDPYTGRTFTNARDLDVDHVVPLKHAHEAGGWLWDAERKRAYANDLSFRGHLVAVAASANRQKGAKGPDEWKPSNRAHWCDYAKNWAAIKVTWNLTIRAPERTALREMLRTC